MYSNDTSHFTCSEVSSCNDSSMGMFARENKCRVFVPGFKPHFCPANVVQLIIEIRLISEIRR